MPAILNGRDLESQSVIYLASGETISDVGTYFAIGSVAVSEDGASVYLLSANRAWVPIGSGGGGGGGGSGGGGVLIVTPTLTQEGSDITETWDKTAGEIMDAMPLVYIKTVDAEQGDVIYHPVSDGDAIGYIWNDDYGFAAGAVNSSYIVTAETRNDYPTATWTDK